MASGRRPSGPAVPGASRPQQVAQRLRGGEPDPRVERLQALLDLASNPTPANVARSAQRFARAQRQDIGRSTFGTARARREAEQVYMPGQLGPGLGPWGPSGRNVSPRLSRQAQPRPPENPSPTNAPVAGFAQRQATAQRRFERAEARRAASVPGLLAARQAEREADYARWHIELRQIENRGWERRMREVREAQLRDERVAARRAAKRAVDADTEAFFLGASRPSNAAAADVSQSAALAAASRPLSAVENPAPEGHSVRAGEAAGSLCKPRPTDNRPKAGGGAGKRWVPWCD